MTSFFFFFVFDKNSIEQRSQGHSSHFHFMGPLNFSSTKFDFRKSGSACLNISNVLQKGKRCLYFHTFVLVCIAYFRNKDFSDLVFS